MTLRIFCVLFWCVLALAPAFAQDVSVPEPDGYRTQDYRAPTPATLKGARVVTTAQAADLWKAGGAVFGFINFAGTESMQQRAHDSPHMSIVVDDEKSQAIKIDADHRASKVGHRCVRLRIKEARIPALRPG